MALLVDLTDEQDDEPHHERDQIHEAFLLTRHELSAPDVDQKRVSTADSVRSEYFARALACYPVAVCLAQNLDLTALHELSRTCRQIRTILLLFRPALMAHAMKCQNDHADHSRARVGPCARDMVGECRRCGHVVCRNCIAKQPSPVALNSRYRRLCKTCLKCPLDAHTASARDTCTCARDVWICQPCGQSLSNLDVQYVRVWTWRERYSTYVGGMGTGIGEGLQGEECGRKNACLAAQEIEKEIECDARELAADIVEAERGKLQGRSWSGTSYYLQEVEGLGGIMKKKVKKRERVGRFVREYEEERVEGSWLARERSGQNRSWCSWCDRVVPSNKDAGLVLVGGRGLEQGSSSSSSLSSL